MSETQLTGKKYLIYYYQLCKFKSDIYLTFEITFFLKKNWLLIHKKTEKKLFVEFVLDKKLLVKMTSVEIVENE